MILSTFLYLKINIKVIGKILKSGLESIKKSKHNARLIRKIQSDISCCFKYNFKICERYL